jgi:anti-sigma factor RsiW
MTTNPQDLDWLAFCYAAGELNSTESEQFEARLADDQAAREALARAVELCQTVTAAETHRSNYLAPAARIQTNWNQRLSWMAVGGLASLLLALLWTGVVGPTWQTAQRNFHAFSQQNLASAWTETRTEIANVREAGYWPSLTSIDSDDELLATVSLIEDRLDENMLEDAPSWMTAAVFSLSANDSPTDAVTNQRLEN